MFKFILKSEGNCEHSGQRNEIILAYSYLYKYSHKLSYICYIYIYILICKRNMLVAAKGKKNQLDMCV